MYWPFGSGKKEKDSFSKNCTINIASTTTDFPGQLTSTSLVGGLEIIAGTAVGLCFGSTVIGGLVAGALLADGIHRMADAGQLDVEAALRQRQRQSMYVDP